MGLRYLLAPCCAADLDGETPAANGSLRSGVAFQLLVRSMACARLRPHCRTFHTSVILANLPIVQTTDSTPSHGVRAQWTCAVRAGVKPACRPYYGNLSNAIGPRDSCDQSVAGECA